MAGVLIPTRTKAISFSILEFEKFELILFEKKIINKNHNKNRLNLKLFK